MAYAKMLRGEKLWMVKACLKLKEETHIRIIDLELK